MHRLSGKGKVHIAKPGSCTDNHQKEGQGASQGMSQERRSTGLERAGTRTGDSKSNRGSGVQEADDNPAIWVRQWQPFIGQQGDPSVT